MFRVVCPRRDADLATRSPWNDEGRSAAAEGRESSAVTDLLGNASQTPARALSAALYVLPLTQVLCLPRGLGLVADELGPPGSPGAAEHSLHLGHAPSCRLTAHTLQKTVLGLFSWETRPARSPLGSPPILQGGHNLACCCGQCRWYREPGPGRPVLTHGVIKARSSLVLNQTLWGGCEGPSGTPDCGSRKTFWGVLFLQSPPPV